MFQNIQESELRRNFSLDGQFIWVFYISGGIQRQFLGFKVFRAPTQISWNNTGNIGTFFRILEENQRKNYSKINGIIDENLKVGLNYRSIKNYRICGSPGFSSWSSWTMRNLKKINHSPWLLLETRKYASYSQNW